jgi:cell wall assembly regulator SMI1
MSVQWHWLEKWLARELPGLLKDLNKGAKPSELTAFEKAVGRSLPEDFKQFYRVHDGQKGACHVGPFYGMNFVPLKEILRIWKSRQATFKAIDLEVYVDVTCFPAGKIRAGGNDPGWIPFADDSGGNYLGIDLSPGTQRESRSEHLIWSR